MKTEDIISKLYKIEPADAIPFGGHWCGPPVVLPHEQTLVAQYAKQAEGGAHVDVYCSAEPARFYALHIKDFDSRISLVMDTGSDQAELTAKMAEAFATGMIGITSFAYDHTL